MITNLTLEDVLERCRYYRLWASTDSEVEKMERLSSHNGGGEYFKKGGLV